MTDEREWQVRLQFLDEAQDYLATIAAALLGMSDRGLGQGAIDQTLRAAHSIKGGAAMMGFVPLSDLAHRLEDFLKVFRAGRGPQITSEIEALFLQTIAGMEQVATGHKQRQALTDEWLQTAIHPPFEQLQALIGELDPEDDTAALSVEAGEDMRVLMFETEVDACLKRLAAVLADQQSSVLREEFAIASQELGCLGEILDLPAFSSLCEGISLAIATSPAGESLQAIAAAALEAWQHSQALVLVGQFALLPAQFEAGSGAAFPVPAPEMAVESLALESLADFLGDTPFPEIPWEVGELSPELPQISQPLPELTAAELLPELPQISDLMPERVAVEADRQRETEEPDVPVSGTQWQPVAPAVGNLPEAAEATVRIPVRFLEGLSDRFGELNAERNGMVQQLRRLRELVELMHLRVRGLETANTQLRETYDQVATSAEVEQPGKVGDRLRLSGEPAPVSPPASSFISRFDLLEMDRYGEFHLLAREIMDSVVQLQEVADDIETALGEVESSQREVGRTARQMQSAIEQARMRMLKEILVRFPRLLRELSLSHGKQVDLVTRGSSTLVERSVLEKLEDPLLHLLRNAFDHGIEDPATRMARGKSPRGQIEIAAGYRGNQTVITVSDDGDGIPLDKVRARALQMGLSPMELEQATPAELVDLIFEPGFSTAAQVTALSGRGVGMDIVRSNLQALGGSVRVETEAGVGTRFILTVPISLSIARVLLVETQGLVMAILATAVEEMVLLRSLSLDQVANQEAILWEGNSVPLLRLSQRLQFSRPQPPVETESRPVIDEPLVLVVTHNDTPFALQIERYWGEQEVTTRNLHSPFALPQGFNGCAVLGGGRIVPLLDIEGLLNWMVATEPPVLPSFSLLPTPGDRRITVLIVDDSINVRRFLSMTLEKAGYRVEQAKDGQEALEKLQQSQQIQAVVCDIEMPRLDGFGFLAQSRSQSWGKNIPVVMLTSRSGIKHRELAQRLGAAAYFTKPFKEQDLLQVLAQLTAPTPVMISPAT